MVAIFADREGFVIAEEVLAEGGEAHVAFTPRKIFGRALNLDARQILLAHNHPSGWAEPSEQDVRLTQSLCRQADELGLSIEDHLIVGAREVVSMKERGLI
ncbi:JAB domain-containing protein [Erythrobacter fulvus]|uniref:JAB domain-containing protein n=1 Tax=Erythrobacter fulvus TaxID=2987523 RepID=UPI0035AB860C